MYMIYVCGYLLLWFKDGRKFCQINPWQTLMNLQYQRYIVKGNLWMKKSSVEEC